MTTLHRDKKKLSIEGKLPESFRVKDRTENSEYGQRLEMALKKCRNGMSQYQAAKLFNIPKAVNIFFQFLLFFLFVSISMTCKINIDFRLCGDTQTQTH